jgi:broad specificity phosphatase PhoE
MTPTCRPRGYRRHGILWGVLIGSLWISSVWASPVWAQQSTDALVERLRSGGHVLMLRHALAPGTGDPAGFRLEDCATQRNLSDAGRAQARAIGVSLRARGIERARVYSSQWCRCLETAQLLGLGPVTPLPALNSFFQRADDREPNLTTLRDFLAAQPGQGEPIILVTHQVTVTAMTGVFPDSGEGVILDLNGTRTPEPVGTLAFED